MKLMRIHVVEETRALLIVNKKRTTESNAGAVQHVVRGRLIFELTKKFLARAIVVRPVAVVTVVGEIDAGAQPPVSGEKRCLLINVTVAVPLRD